MIKKMELFLLKAQGALNMNYTAAGATTFAGSDLIEVLDGSTIDSQQTSEAVVNVAGVLDQDAAIPGEEPSKGTINMKMIPAVNSGDSIPDWARMLTYCCAFSSAQTTSAGADYFLITPISTFTNAGIIQHYTGSTDSNGSIAAKHYNCVADWKITLSANKVPEISFPLVGAFYGESAGTQPSVSKARVSATALKGATIVIIGSSTYRFISGDISGNQAPQNTTDPSQSNGMGVSKITDRKIKSTAKVYADTIATNDPKTALRNSTEGAIQFQWGSGASKINIGGTYAQITKCERADQNGITTYDLELQWNRNNFKIELNPA